MCARVCFFTEGKGTVPENKREEFMKRIEMLFQAGGMMELEKEHMLGVEVTTIRKAKMNEKGMRFSYNYFEEDDWDHAGFCKENCRVWSGEVGWNHFCFTVVAAYTLLGFYTEGVTAAKVNGSMVTYWRDIAWINYLFDEHFFVKNYDPWKLFEAIHYASSDNGRYFAYGFSNYVFGFDRYAFIGQCEIYAVMHNTKDALEKFSKEAEGEADKLEIKAIALAMDVLESIATTEVVQQETSLDEFIKSIRTYYEQRINENDIADDRDSIFGSVARTLLLTDAPALIIKKLAEIYDKDFWDLWSEVRDVVERREDVFSSHHYYVKPLSTEEFLQCSSDDMIPYWKENDKWDFSIDLWRWFDELRNEFEELMHSDMAVAHPVQYVLRLMKEADENYYHIFTFTDFWEETLENMTDKRYLVLWKLYEKMLQDPEMKTAGDVIFKPEEQEYNTKCAYQKDEKRYLTGDWCLMDPVKKNNKARVILRRYMALVANKELRQKVFGF